MLNMGCGGFQRQVRLEGIGVERERHFPDIQTRTIDERLYRTAFAQRYSGIDVGYKPADRIQHCQILQRSERLYDG